MTTKLSAAESLQVTEIPGERPGFVEDYDVELIKSRGVAPPVPDQEMTVRLQRVRELMVSEELDGLLIYGAPDEPTWTRYLANYVFPFVIAEAFLLIAREGDPILFIDREWFLPQAREMSPVQDIRVLPYVEFPWQFQTLVKTLEDGLRDVKMESGRLGICELDMPALYGRALNATSQQIETVDATNLLSALIEAKSEYDQEMVRRTASIADATMWEALRTCQAGVPEYEVGIAAERVAAARGAEWGSGTTSRTHIYVASGSEISSNVRPFRYTARRLEPGDMFFIDLSVCFRGYYIDFCRSVVIGQPTPEQQRVFDGVMACHQYVMERLRSGLTGANIFQLGLESHRSTTPEWENYINWVWLGHGTGLIISEPPFFTPGETRTVKSNSFVNIEPGLFIPGIGNASVEDTLFVSNDGVTLVTECPRDLYVG